MNPGKVCEVFQPRFQLTKQKVWRASKTYRFWKTIPKEQDFEAYHEHNISYRKQKTPKEYVLEPLNIFPKPVDGFWNFKRRLEAEKILQNMYRTDFKIFVLMSFVFSLNSSFILIFRCIKSI